MGWGGDRGGTLSIERLRAKNGRRVFAVDHFSKRFTLVCA